VLEYNVVVNVCFNLLRVHLPVCLNSSGSNLSKGNFEGLYDKVLFER
jgi:hypothetical protein